MIVLDVTIVNVALPTIQDSLGFSQSGLAWVVNAYLIPFGGLLLLAGRLGDLLGQRRMFLIGLARLRRRFAALRRRREPGDADRRPLLRRRRRRACLGRDPGHDRDDVPRAARAGESDRRLRLRRLGGRLDRPAARRHPDPGDQLALDLRHQPADRHRHRLRGHAPGRGQARPRLQGRRRHSRRGPDHQLADDRRLRHPRRQRARLGLRPDPDPLRRLVRPRRRLHHPPGEDREPADAAAALPLAQRGRAPT